MGRPNWKPDGAEEIAAFTQWIHAELDRADEAFAAEGNDPFTTRFVEHRLALIKGAREHGLSLTEPRRRGRPATAAAKLTNYQLAARDVPRIRNLFVQHWGKRNRTVRPLAEEIAAERWELSPAETAKLIDKFQRKS